MGLPDAFVDYNDFLHQQETYEGKIEYHNGKIVYISPTSIKHNKIITNIVYELKKYFKGSKCEVHSEQIAVLFENDNEKYEYQPDVFVICEGKTKGEKYISSPIIIFEVVSKSTASNDYFSKPLIYSKFGVREYNIIEQNGSIIQYGLEDGIYIIKNTSNSKGNYQSIVFSDLSFSFEKIF